MKLFSTTIAISCLLFAACSNEPQPVGEAAETSVAVAEHPTSAPTEVSTIAAEEVAPASALTEVTGAAVETMDAGGYTYALLDTGDATVWVAGPTARLSVGDIVSASGLMQMVNFHSNAMERDFEMIYFAGELSSTAIGSLHVDPVTPAADATEEPVSITKAEGGYTVEDIWLMKDELVGKEVTIHANVVKFSADIMKTNWIHLQDGSGSEESKTNDLTITTDGTAEVGDVVMIRGILTADKDFGFGYKYALIIEGAEVTIE